MPITKHIIISILCVALHFTSSAQADTVINSYAAVLSLINTCNNSLTVDNITGFNVGDDVLLIQMKGVEIDTTNTSTFGQIINWGGCGNYELNKVQSISGNSITLQYAITKTYNIPSGKVQLIKVPHFSSYFINKVHTAMPWNGNKGGVFAIIADDSLVLNNNISVTGKGFLGGITINPIYHTQFVCNQQDYCYPISQIQGAHKGEGIGTVSNNRIFCRGPLYNGGGGGNGTNCGGGGGGNGGEGGRGGNQWSGCNSQTLGGIGGKVFNYTSINNKLFLGGGGGAGNTNNGVYAPGGNGGGIAIIITNKIKGNNNSILADGNQGQDCNTVDGICDDGMGGGGAGGTVLINAQTASQLNVSVKGGRGANASNISPHRHGPGGGGGGGALLANTQTVLSSINYNLSGGMSGMILNYSTNWSAMPGNSGDTSIGIIATIDTLPFIASLPAVINDSVLGCKQIKFTAASSQPITSWSWNFGDNTTGFGNPVNHTYLLAGTYTVTLIVSNAICQDTFTKQINVVNPNINLLITDSLSGCNITKLSILNSGNPITQYLWDLGDGNSTNSNPVIHNYSQPGNYNISLIVTDNSGCTDTFAKLINIPNKNINLIIKDSTVECKTVELSVINLGNPLNQYLWDFGDGNSGNSTPVIHNYPQTGNYNVSLVVTDNLGCTDTFTKSINVEGIKYAIQDSLISCLSMNFTAVKVGPKTATKFFWTFENGQTSIVNPIKYTFSKQGNYSVVLIVTDDKGCADTISTNINVISDLIQLIVSNDTTICYETRIGLQANGAKEYLWKPNMEIDKINVANPFVTPTENRTYYVTGTDENGCIGYDSVRISLLPVPEIKITSSFPDITCDRESVQLFASGAVSYVWTPAEYFTDNTVRNPIVSPKIGIRFGVTGTDANGCSGSASIPIYANKDVRVFVPSAFTPNGDGLNDYIKITPICHFTLKEFSIFNRWGELLFVTNDPNIGWDGTYNGILQGIGVYFYFAKGVDGNNYAQTLKGDFTLIK